MEIREFVRTAIKKVAKKVADGSLDVHEDGYDDQEEMLLDWIWIELKEESPDKDAVITMELDDLYEVIESAADMYENYQILLESIRSSLGN
jgi:hypothetical protein